MLIQLLITICLVLLAICIYLYINRSNNKTINKTNCPIRNKKIVIKEKPIIQYIVPKYHEERLDNRLDPPSIEYEPRRYVPRRYESQRYEPRRYVPLNIRTRGMPTEYQQLGILTNIENTNDIKPLYGRQTYRGSNKWNYYSSTDTDLAIKIPVYLTSNKCTDERGCSEIIDNSECTVGDKNTNIYKATIYSSDNYRYIPDIL